MNAQPRAFATCLALVLVAAASHAQNDGQKLACIDAHEAGQALRQDGKWRDARAKFVECAVDACPAPVRRECGPWAKELETGIPSVLVRVEDASGNPLTNATVSIDEERSAVVTATLLDPGTHIVRANLGGYTSVERSIVLREGERQTVTITLAPLPSELVAHAAPTSTASPTRPPDRPVKRSNLPAWIAVGVAGAATASFATFGLFGRNLESSYASSCAPDCSQGDRSAVKFHYAMADISLAAAVAAVGVAVVLFVTQGSAEPTRSGGR